jgi:hypothetical protein
MDESSREEQEGKSGSTSLMEPEDIILKKIQIIII